MREEKKKKSSNRMGQSQFLILWLLAHGVGAAILAGVYYFFSQSILNLNLAEWSVLAFLILIAGALPGLIFSIPQKWLIKRGFGIDVSWWRRASIVAYVLGWLANYLVVITFPMSFIAAIPFFFPLLRYSPIILVQVLLLRRYIPRAWLWGLASLVSMVLFPQMSLLSATGQYYWNFILLAPLQAAVTGLTLLWLYGMTQQDKAQEEHTLDDNNAIERLSDKLEDEEYRLEDGTLSVSTASLD